MRVLVLVRGVGDVDILFQAEDVIRDLVRSRGLGDVYKRQTCTPTPRSSRMRPCARSCSQRIEEWRVRPRSPRTPTLWLLAPS